MKKKRIFAVFSDKDMKSAKRLLITIVLLFCSYFPTLVASANTATKSLEGDICVSTVGRGYGISRPGELPGWSLLCKHDVLPAGITSSISTASGNAQVSGRTHSSAAHYARPLSRGISCLAVGLAGPVQENSHSLALPRCAAEYFVFTLMVIRC